MKNSIWLAALAIGVTLTACDKTPVVVNVPAETIVVPGPAGPTGKTGDQGIDGNKGNMGDKGNTGNTGVQGNDGSQGKTGEVGETGKNGDSTTVIITAPPAEPTTSN